MDTERIVKLTTGPIFTWWVKHVASRLDPLIFKATNGRLTSMGPAAMPMLTLTTVGRRSGKPHAVHLACLERGGDYLIVASAIHAAHRVGMRRENQAQCRSLKLIPLANSASTSSARAVSV